MFEITDVENSTALHWEIEGYQFPENQSDNWCMLKIKVSQGESEFDKTDPALETMEVVELYHWFKALASDTLPRYATLTFTEPCIRFSFLAYIDGEVRFSVGLSNELKPDFKQRTSGGESDDWEIEFSLDVAGLTKILEGIEAAMEKCPVRQ